MAQRFLLIGGPRIGKSTLSLLLQSSLGISTLHKSHDIEHLEWSASSEFASHWFDDPGDWIIEGVQMARGLRKWLDRNPGKPLDCDIIYLSKPFVRLLPGQERMTKGVQTVFNEIEREVLRRGARIHRLKHPDDAIKLFNLTSQGGR